LEALKAATADMFRPLRLNLSDMRSLNTVYDLEDYQVGTIFGVLQLFTQTILAVIPYD
jgi:hypothetical protein